MDGTVTDSYFQRELQYDKLLKNICTKHEQKYTKELEPNNTGSTDKDIYQNLLQEIRRLRSKKQKYQNTLPTAPLKTEGERRSFDGHVDEEKEFKSCSHAPTYPPRFNQCSIFLPQVQWGRSTYKTRIFKKVTHCIFDMDGTIIDTESQYHKILKDLCAKHGKKYTQELKSKNFGATDKQITENVVKDLQLNMSASDLGKELQAMTKIGLPKSPLKKGAERLMKHLVRSGVLLAMATNSTRRDVRLHIATKPKIFRLFHHMVCAGDPDVDRGKPYPDPYLMAAFKFPDKPLPAKCLVFEDSLVGLEAGLTAGMQCTEDFELCDWLFHVPLSSAPPSSVSMETHPHLFVSKVKKVINICMKPSLFCGHSNLVGLAVI